MQTFHQFQPLFKGFVRKNRRLQVSYKKYPNVYFVIFMMVILLAIFWSFIYYRIHEDKKATEKNVYTNITNHVIGFEEHTKSLLNYGDQILLISKYNYERLGDKSFPILKEYYKSNSQDMSLFNQIGIIDKDGMYVFSNKDNFKKVDLSFREHYQVHRKKNYPQTTFISTPFTSPAPGKPCIALTQRLNNKDGSFNGVVTVSFEPNLMFDFYKKISIGSNSLVTLVGEDRKIRTLYLDQKDESLLFDKELDFPMEMQDHENGTFKSHQLYDKVSRYYAFEKVANRPLYVIAGISEEQALSGFYQSRFVLLFVGILLSLLGVVFSLAICRQFIRSERSNKQLNRNNRVIADSIRQLEILKNSAETANLTKSKFLATMSHEIRTPLNGVLGMAQVLLTKNVSQREKNHLARTILNSGKTLQVLLNDILDFSKVEAGKLELINSPTNPLAIIQEVEQLFKEVCRAKGLVLRYEYTGPNEELYLLDALRVKQILTNLTSNAIKFTSSGSVMISCTEIQRQNNIATLDFSITDSGTGISPEQQALLFQPFSQINVSPKSLLNGTGLGLSIVSNFVKLMGGEYGVRSELGQGSTFWFKIPAVMIDGGVRDSQQIAQSSTDSPMSDTPAEPLSGKVFIVEDNKTNQVVLESLISTISDRIEVVIFDGGQACFDVFKNDTCVNLILMDSQMPLLSGEETTKMIREFEAVHHLQKTPIVAVSALVYDDDRDRFFKVGMDDFLPKPIDLMELQRVLSQWLNPVQIKEAVHHFQPDPILSLAIFNEEDMLSRLGGNRRLANSIFMSAITEIPKFLNRLNESILENHWVEAQMILHTLKGLTSQIGGDRLAKEAAQLEQMLRSGLMIQSSQVQILEAGFKQLVEARRQAMSSSIDA